LRPAFCYWGYRAASDGSSDEIVRAASALEILHTFAIVHDDVMDAAEQRRWQPTTHSLYGVDVAILVGDLALVLADTALMESGFTSDVLPAAFSVYSRMRREVIAGQYLDLRNATHHAVTVEEARLVARLKSGRYSVAEPLAIGATLAGAGQELVQGLFAFGEAVGEAFQLVDDLLGTLGDESETGKATDSDIREGKRNVLFALTVDSLSGDVRERLIARWGASDLTDDEVVSLRELVASSEAPGRLRALRDELIDRAIDALQGQDVPDDVKSALLELAERAVARRM
jgi:geranylgeranyl diphosphate synthase type I